MDRKISKREKEEGKLKCVRCGFDKAECLEYTVEGLMCQNCIFLRMTEKEREAKNLSELIGKMEEGEDEDDVGETYEGTRTPVKGFTIELTNTDILMPGVA